MSTASNHETDRLTKFTVGVAIKFNSSNHTPLGQVLCEWESSFTYLQDLGVGQIAHPPVGMCSEIHLACRPCEGALYNINGTFNFMSYVSALSEMTVTLQVFFNHTKVTTTRN